MQIYSQFNKPTVRFSSKLSPEQIKTLREKMLLFCQFLQLSAFRSFYNEQPKHDFKKLENLLGIDEKVLNKMVKKPNSPEIPAFIDVTCARGYNREPGWYFSCATNPKDFAQAKKDIDYFLAAERRLGKKIPPLTRGYQETFILFANGEISEDDYLYASFDAPKHLIKI